MSTAVIIVAAGRGSRAGGDIPKQWQMLAGKPVLCHTVAAFGDLPKILVIHPDDRALAESLFPGLWLVEGGADRASSVINALSQLEGCDVTRVLIHDGARPFVSQAVINGVLAALDQHEAAAPALPVSDALWRGANGFVAATQDRAGLYRAQTPQGFRFPAILHAHRNHPGHALDDVEVARAAGIEVAITEGDEDNIKLTYPADFARGERLLKGR